MEEIRQEQREQFARRKKVSWFILICLFILLLIAAGYYFLVYRFYESTDNAYVKADVTWIVPRVAGEVIQLDVQDHQTVTKGQLLLALDNRDFQARYDQAKALLELKQANFAVQDENENAALASIREAQSSQAAVRADYERLSADYQRYKGLLSDGVITRQHFDTIQAQFLTAKAQLNNAQSTVDAAQAQLASIRAGRPQLKADVDNAKATVALYDLDRSSSQVVAPVDGKIGSLSVRLGSRVSPQTRLLAIIPNGSTYIEANFKETQIEKMHIGQLVALKLDAYPDVELQGKIESFSPASGAVFSMMPPDNATGNFNKVVQRIPVRIALEPNSNLDLVKPGLSVIATVDLRS